MLAHSHHDQRRRCNGRAAETRVVWHSRGPRFRHHARRIRRRRPAGSLFRGLHAAGQTTPDRLGPVGTAEVGERSDPRLRQAHDRRARRDRRRPVEGTQRGTVGYVPTFRGLRPRHTAVLDRLRALEGAEFDKSYAQAQLSARTETVEQLDADAQTGGNADLRRFAEATLPRLQSELEHARRIAGQ
ncbi:MAG TPA: DUF4142 domain-containing protein [Reyranella sp.]|nr:DUF4142 domain-containing protein [Reyranella sp.]